MAAWRRVAPSVVVAMMVVGARRQDAVESPQLLVVRVASSLVMRRLLWVVMAVVLASLVAVWGVLVASDALQDERRVAQASLARPLHIHHKTSRRGEWDGGSWNKA
jgi:hypothetical protein